MPCATAWRSGSITPTWTRASSARPSCRCSTDHPELGRAFRADLAAVYDRDPACNRYIEPLLYFKGFHALVTHRFAHELWKRGRRDFALYLQSQSSRIFAVDINPAARIGIGIMLDHGTGIVIGETATLGDNCSLLQGVTLGGTGKETGDRHPKIGANVMIGAGAKVLGNITVGNCCRIASGSVVLKDVPPETTVAGVPAKVVGRAGCPEPARDHGPETAARRLRLRQLEQDRFGLNDLPRFNYGRSVSC